MARLGMFEHRINPASSNASPHRRLSLRNPGAREAYLVSWASVACTLAAVVLGLVTSRVSGSPAMLAFALENVVDALSSCVCLWRFWGGGSLLLPEEELAGRERRAAAAIAIAFVVLGALVGLNAVLHLANGEEVEHHELLAAVSAPSTVAFGVLGLVKLHIGRRCAPARVDGPARHAPSPTGSVRPDARPLAPRIESGSLRKDGLCSLAGALLSRRSASHVSDTRRAARPGRRGAGLGRGPRRVSLGCFRDGLLLACLRAEGLGRPVRCGRASSPHGRCPSSHTRRLGVWASANAGPALWWLDAAVAVAVAGGLVWYGRRELRAHEGQWRRRDFWRETDARTTTLKAVADEAGGAVEDPDELL